MTTEDSLPIIVGFVADVMFTTRIQSAARAAGFRMRWIEQAAQLGGAEADAPAEAPGEMLHGREGRLFAQITQWQPALLLFDLNNHLVPWAAWIPLLKSSPATRRLPILCFGPHEDVAAMSEARRVGADAVLARSRFTSAMPALLKQHARLPDYGAINAACDEPLTPLARRGIEKYNQGLYYECHDDLEAAWKADTGAGRDLYRAILQVGIALFQVRRDNYRGAVKMLLRVRQWLQHLPDQCRGVDVVRLRANVETYADAVTRLGVDRLHEFEWQLVEPIYYQQE